MQLALNWLLVTLMQKESVKAVLVTPADTYSCPLAEWLLEGGADCSASHDEKSTKPSKGLPVPGVAKPI